MTLPIRQYDFEVLHRIEEILRDDLPAVITALNVELDDAAPLAPIIIVVGPEDAQLASREDATLDERSEPKAMLGIWLRITGSEEVLGVGGSSGFGGQSRTKHRLEMLTFVNNQEYERAAFTPTTATSGYKTAMLLSRAASIAVTENLSGTAGVYNVLRAAGNRIPTALKALTYVHQVRDFYDIWQCTRR